jgi:hypothetical protein
MNARLVLVPAIALLAAGIVWFTQQPVDGTPAATWRTGTGTEVKQGRNWDELPAETPVRLSFHSDASRYVYVFSHSQTDGTVLLFPSPDVLSDLRQPLAAGQSVLPGKNDSKELAWTTRAEVLPATTFLVVAASEPVAELDALLPKLRRWSNRALTSRLMAVTSIKEGEVVAGPAQPLPHPLLLRAAELSMQSDLVNGPLVPDVERPGTWLGSWRVKERAAPK